MCQSSQKKFKKKSNSFRITFFHKSYPLLDNVEKYGRSREATYDNFIQRMRFACVITKATHTHTHTLRIRLRGNTGNANALPSSVKCPPPVLLNTDSQSVILAACKLKFMYSHDICNFRPTNDISTYIFIYLLYFIFYWTT